MTIFEEKILLCEKIVNLNRELRNYEIMQHDIKETGTDPHNIYCKLFFSQAGYDIMVEGELKEEIIKTIERVARKKKEEQEELIRKVMS